MLVLIFQLDDLLDHLMQSGVRRGDRLEGWLIATTCRPFTEIPATKTALLVTHRLAA